jgi:hypothetical protein
LTPVDILSAANGMTVSLVWFGDYKAMYIELGKLAPSKHKHPQGEVTVYAGFHWQGEIEKPHGTAILGAKILNVEVQPDSELLVAFSNGIRLSTGVKGEEAEWSVTVQNCAHLSADKGRLHVDPAKS